MSKVQEIVQAAERLGLDDFLLLREQLDRLEERFWAVELAQCSAEAEEANLTDAEIDEIVTRRRRERRHSCE